MIFSYKNLMNKKFSIIIPIYNEEESIFLLLEEIIKTFSNNKPEIIIVNDGSDDQFLEKFNSKFLSLNNLILKNHTVNLGKSMAMLTGIKSAQNNIIAVIDGDGQNPPKEIKKLISTWNNQKNKKYLIVCGNRIKRQDTFLKKMSSLIANKVRKKLLNDECNDTACALKVFDKKDYITLPYFRNMHRFLPALFKMKGGKIINIDVEDRKRLKGISKFNFNNRFWIGIIDLLKVWLLIKKERRKS